jgi:serine/threonine protein kinase
MNEHDQHSLNPGSYLKHYRILNVLGEGGFGITYLAEDTQLGMKVVIKEYFPNEFAMRTGDSTITAKSTSKGDFTKGMQRFKEEAQTLAKFNHPSIVKILGYFEANDTAYFVMEYEKGIDLAHHIKVHGTPFSQEEILTIIMPILEGLKEVHRHHFLHRDIKPANILIRTDKAPVLIDFGASKLAMGEASKSITSMLTEGYAPLEQYSTDIKKQGPFTDIYAIAAVIYKMITGEVPPSSQTRSYAILSGEEDPYRPLSQMKLKGYDKSFLAAVDRALSVSAKERPQSVEEFQKDIAGQLTYKEKQPQQTTAAPVQTKEGKKNNVLIGVLIGLIVVAVGVLGYLLIGEKKVGIPPSKYQTVYNKAVAQAQKQTDVAIQKAKKIQEDAIKEAEEQRKKNEALIKKALEVAASQTTQEMNTESEKRAEEAEQERLRKEREELKRMKEEKERLEAEKARMIHEALEEEKRREAQRQKEQLAQEEARRQAARQQAASNAPLYKVINVSRYDTLNVRSDPYVTPRNKIGELQPYTSGFRVLKTTTNYKGTKWAYIDYNGLQGWVIARSIAPVGTPIYTKKKVKKQVKKKKKTYRKSSGSNVWYCEARSARASGWVRKVGKQNAINGALRQCNMRRQTSSRCRITNCHIVR